MPPEWLHHLSMIVLVVCAVCAGVIALDILRGRPQRMWIMNVVWPVTALYLGPWALWKYWTTARARSKQSDGDAMQDAMAGRRDGSSGPSAHQVFIGATHCGAGCVLGDFMGEWLVFLMGLQIAGSTLYANFALDFALAYIAGVVFQYFSIAPMRGLSGWTGIAAAMKADTISLVAFEVGMFAFMAISSGLFQPKLEPVSPVYWFMMQIAMIVGFVTALPANWWLIRRGWKEAMG